MSPDLKLTAFADVLWRAETMREGTLYCNANPDPTVQQGVSLLRGLVTGERQLDELPVLSNEGMTACVYGEGPLAVKAFTEWLPATRQNPYHPACSGLPYLQASVAVQEGLARNAATHDYVENGVTFSFVAPVMYGLFRPGHRLDVAGFPISVMSRCSGRGRSEFGCIPVPSATLRHRAVADALAAAGLPAKRAHIDDTGNNVFVERTGPAAVAVTQLDIRGAGRNLWKIGPLTRRERVARVLATAAHIGFQL